MQWHDRKTWLTCGHHTTVVRNFSIVASFAVERQKEMDHAPFLLYGILWYLRRVTVVSRSVLWLNSNTLAIVMNILPWALEMNELYKYHWHVGDAFSLSADSQELLAAFSCLVSSLKAYMYMISSIEWETRNIFKEDYRCKLYNQLLQNLLWLLILFKRKLNLKNAIFIFDIKNW